MPVVELWEFVAGEEGMLALRREGASTAWVDLDLIVDRPLGPRGERLSPFRLDAEKLGDFRGASEEVFEEWRQAGAREIEWDEFRETRPTQVATWKMGQARITRPDDKVLRGGQPGPRALRYISPNGPFLPDELLQFSRDLVGKDAAQIIGVTARTMRELPQPANGGEPLLRGGRRAGRDWMFDPYSVWDYAGSVRKTGPNNLRRRLHGPRATASV